MSRPQGFLIQNLRRVVEVPNNGPIADAELLDRWLNNRDEAAFELLLRRYGPMILAASRRQTGDANAAEDAFQATWLVFLRHANAIRRRDSLAAWLHRVACRVALRIRTSAAKQMDRERPGLPATAFEIAKAKPLDEPELRSMLDEELNRLPRHYRWAFVVCVLEGKPFAEAAHELGRPQGTIASWAARAREKLRDRLGRRGVALSAGTASLLTGEELAASLPSPLITSMVGAARANGINRESSSGAVSPKAAALAREVGKIMSMSKIKVVALVMTLVLLAATGVLVIPVSPKGDEKPGNAAPIQSPKTDPPTNLVAKTQPEVPAGAVVPTPVLEKLDTFQHEEPQGKILRRISDDVVEIDLGSDALVRPGLTFSVLPNDYPEKGRQSRIRVFRAKDDRGEYKDVQRFVDKASIEVVEVVGPKRSRARITGEYDKIRDGVGPGDLLYNLAWRKGKADHIALIGIFDINSDGNDAIEAVVRDFLKMGIPVDAYFDMKTRQWMGQVDSQTRYIVQGYFPVITGASDALLGEKSKLREAINNAIVQAQTKGGAQTVNFRDFFPRLGYRVKLDVSTDKINQAAGPYLEVGSR